MAITAWIRAVGGFVHEVASKWFRMAGFRVGCVWISGDEITKMTIVRWVKNQLLDKTGGSMEK